jgi:hypothetical protein
MKKLLFLLSLLAMTVSTFAQGRNETKASLMGTWKFSKKTVINDYEMVFKNIQTYQSEYYTFEPNNIFTHDFFDKEGNLIRTLTGHWKSNKDKINLKYDEVAFNIKLDYHFTDIGNDLVFGQDFNHVILTKAVILSESENVALN